MSAVLSLVPSLSQGAAGRTASTGGDNPPVVAGGRFPVEGSMAWLRVWYGDGFRRGAQVRVDGCKARILSAASGFVYVLVWSTGRRVRVRPGEISFPN